MRSPVVVNGSQRILIHQANSKAVSSTTTCLGAPAPASWARSSLKLDRRSSVVARAKTKRAGWDDASADDIGIIDYYKLLGVPESATKKEIKTAYYSIAKECHPDVDGENGHLACIMLNEAYDLLSSPDRGWYTEQLRQAREDFEDGFTGEPRSKWGKKAPLEETRAVFVDECTCIGCKNCVWAAPAVFRLEPEHGRSYVFGQWFNDEDAIQQAIESCPVDCIHWVDKEELPALEHVMAKISRVGVGIMQQGMGIVEDPFAAAASYAKRRAEKLKKRASKEREQRARESKAEAALRKAAANHITYKVERRANADWTVPPERALVPFGVIVEDPPAVKDEAAAEKAALLVE